MNHSSPYVTVNARPYSGKKKGNKKANKMRWNEMY